MHSSTATVTYSIFASSSGPEARCTVYRNVGEGRLLISTKRGRDVAEAVREAVSDIRRARRGGMLTQRVAGMGWPESV